MRQKRKTNKKIRKIGYLAGLVLALSGPAAAQNLAPPFSYGPSIPFLTAEWDSIGSHGGFHGGLLNQGAGISFNANFLPSADGTIRYLTLGTTVFGNFQGGDPSNFQLMVGETIGVLNNLFAIGPAIRILDVAPGAAPRGVFANGFDKSDLVLMVSCGLNLGGGSPPVPIHSLLKSESARKSDPPPGYFKLW